MIADTISNPVETITTSEQAILDEEFIMRNILENARKVKNIAERHLDNNAKVLTLTICPKWKKDLAKMAINYIAEGGNVKSFMSVLKDSTLGKLENNGEIFAFWSKRMLPQVFKWDDQSKLLINGEVDEYQLLSARTEFLALELGLEEVRIQSGEDLGDKPERVNSAMPLSPAVTYA